MIVAMYKRYKRYYIIVINTVVAKSALRVQFGTFHFLTNARSWNRRPFLCPLFSTCKICFIYSPVLQARSTVIPWIRIWSIILRFGDVCSHPPDFYLPSKDNQQLTANSLVWNIVGFKKEKRKKKYLEEVVFTVSLTTRLESSAFQHKPHCGVTGDGACCRWQTLIISSSPDTWAIYPAYEILNCFVELLKILYLLYWQSSAFVLKMAWKMRC